MEIEFLDPAEAPLPPDQMSFRAVEVDPYADGQRLKVSIQLTPFQVRPSIDLEVKDQDGNVVASSSIIEATETHMSVTMHLPSRAPQPRRTLHVALIYPDHGPVDERILDLSAPRLDEDAAN